MAERTSNSRCRVHLHLDPIGVWPATCSSRPWSTRGPHPCGATSWSVGPLPLGGGIVDTAHGKLPVPAPATALLLEGFEVVDEGLPGERVTPDGRGAPDCSLGGAVGLTRGCGSDGTPERAGHDDESHEERQALKNSLGISKSLTSTLRNWSREPSARAKPNSRHRRRRPTVSTCRRSSPRGR